MGDVRGDVVGGAWLAGGFRCLAEGMDDDLEHLFFGRGFPGPDLKLTGTLLDEHLYACDDGDTLAAGELEQWGIDGVVDEVEDEFGLEGGRVDQELAGKT